MTEAAGFQGEGDVWLEVWEEVWADGGGGVDCWRERGGVSVWVRADLMRSRRCY